MRGFTFCGCVCSFGLGLQIRRLREPSESWASFTCTSSWGTISRVGGVLYAVAPRLMHTDVLKADLAAVTFVFSFAVAARDVF